MHVLMTADGVGGVFGFALDLSRALAARGVSVTLAVLGPRITSDQRALLRGVRDLAVHERAGALEWMQEPWADVDACSAWLTELSARVRPDVVHVNGYAHATCDFGVPKLVVAPSCVLGWWRAVHGRAMPEPDVEYVRRVRAGLGAADFVAAPTRAMLDSLQLEYGFAGGHVIPNGVDSAEFEPQQKAPYFAAAGRFWDPAKNLELVQRVAPKLPWPVRLAGQRGESEDPFTGIEPLGLLPRAELAQVLGRASAFLHPARYEPFGLAPLEAAHAGCALVLGDIPSLREVWDRAALYVLPDDPDALAYAAERVARNEYLRQALSEMARARARRYTSAAMARNYLFVYRKLVRAARHSSVRSLNAGDLGVCSPRKERFS